MIAWQESKIVIHSPLPACLTCLPACPVEFVTKALMYMQTRFITFEARGWNWYRSVLHFKPNFNVGIWFNTLNIIKVINHLESRLLYALVVWFSLDLYIQFFKKEKTKFEIDRRIIWAGEKREDISARARNRFFFYYCKIKKEKKEAEAKAINNNSKSTRQVHIAQQHSSSLIIDIAGGHYFYFVTRMRLKHHIARASWVCFSWFIIWINFNHIFFLLALETLAKLTIDSRAKRKGKRVKCTTKYATCRNAQNDKLLSMSHTATERKCERERKNCR